MKRNTGFTLIELLVVIAIIALLIGLLLPALAKAQANARSLRDKTQIKQVHQSMLIFASQNKDILPTPGLINRNADPFVGQQPGIGPENFAANTSANLYSALIAQNYFKTDIVIGTTENNPRIVEKKDYDYNDYTPATDSYWDATFTSDPATASNTSYSHLALCGQRKRLQWRNTQSAAIPCVSTRGTGGSANGFGGASTGDEYSKSPTLDLHEPKRQWDGHVAFNDNHTDTLTSFYHPLVIYYININQTKDNIFACEFNDYPPDGRNSGDSWVCMSTAANTTGTNVTPRFDPLNP